MNERISKIYETIVHLTPHQVLDIGCGNGFLLSTLNQVGIAGQGIDISAEAVRCCHQIGVTAFQVDIDSSNLPLADNFFDIVVCGEVIEHLFDTDHLLEEIYRTLSSSGYLILTTPNLGWWLNRIALLFGYQPYNTEISSRYNLGKPRKVFDGVAGHIRPFTYRSLRELVALHGFSIIECFGTHDLSMPVPALKTLDKMLSRKISIASNIGVICQKIAN